MPENNHEAIIDGYVYPDAVTVILSNDHFIGSRDYVSKELYESVNDANAAWQTENAKLREFASDAFSMAFNFYHGAGTAEDLRQLELDYHELEAENAKLRKELAVYKGSEAEDVIKYLRQECASFEDMYRAEASANAKLQEQIERLQPKDCEGNVLDIADTVNMLRSEYDGDHEWDDVVVELALTKWGGDRWIVRGSKGEAWACDCEKTGYDEDAFEDSGDVEPFDDATLAEVENAKLRKLLEDVAICASGHYCYGCPHQNDGCDRDERLRKFGIETKEAYG